MRPSLALMLLAFACPAATAQGKPLAPPKDVSQAFDRSVTAAERATLALAEALPEDRYNFAPTQGAFKGVRTFALLVKHIAVDNYVNGAILLGEKSPIDPGPRENGSDSIRTKAEILSFLRDSFAYLHKAMATVNEHKLMKLVALPDGARVARLMVVTSAISHPWDIYGQMIEYLRMNGIDPQKI